jgi:Uma2 family endonuclease
MPPASAAVPTFDEIAALAPDERKVFWGVGWDFYKRVGDVVGERPWIRVAYDGKDLEIMPVGPFHDQVAGLASDLAKTLAEELDIPFKPMRSTTWMRPEVKRGIEADESFYFLLEKLAAAKAAHARKSNDVADYPNPDMAIEVDISRPQIDRPSIYAALKVTELWRLSEDGGVIIERLTEQGSCAAVEASAFLRIRKEEVARWVFEEDWSDLADWERRLRAWVRAELATRPIA